MHLHIKSDVLTELIRAQVENRGIKTMTGLFHYLQKQDINGDGCLNKYELEKALIEYHIDVDDEVTSYFLC